MHSPNSIMFEDPEDKESFRALSSDLFRLEATTKRKISVAINDIAKYNESMLPLTLRQKKGISEHFLTQAQAVVSSNTR